MTQIMNGVRVLDVSMWAFVPSAAAILADWGADVVKVEQKDFGDPTRTMPSWGVPGPVNGFAYVWETCNRGKRAIAMDLASPGGRDVLIRLVESADVFMTNFLPTARAKLGIDVEDIMAINPRIVYARGTAQGAKGPERGKGGFDGISYWARSGASVSIAPDELEWTANMPGPGFGDVQSGVALAGGVAGALFHRERTGKGVVVDTSLFAMGAWAMQPTLVGSQMIEQDGLPYPDRDKPGNPVSNIYRTADGRFIHLAMLQSERYWDRFCAVIERPDLRDDPRFATHADRERNTVECTVELTKTFLERTLDEWIPLLGAQEGQWDVMRRPAEILTDEQARANGYVQTVDYGDGRSMNLIAAPMQFDEEAPTLRRSPGHGEHTDEILLEAGLTWDEIVALKVEGAIN